MDVDSRVEWIIRVEDTIVCGKVVGLHSEQCQVTLADASNPFAIASLIHANKKTLQDIPTVCVNSFEMAESITSCIGKEERSLLERSRNNAIEIVLPACGTMPEILGDGFPYFRLRIFEDGIINEIITNLARPLAMYADGIQDRALAGCQSAAKDNSELCRELQVPEPIILFYNTHRQPTVIDSSGKSEEDLIEIIGKHKVAEYRNIPKTLEQSSASRFRPKTPMLIVDRQQISIAKDMNLRIGVLTFGKIHSLQNVTLVKNLSPTGDTIEAAAQLYPALKALDNVGLQLVLVDRLPNAGFGSAINERLRAIAYDLQGSNEILEMG